MTTSSTSPVIAISGASAGIGLAIAEHFAALSWQVTIAARTHQDLVALEQRWPSDFPGSELHIKAVDLAQPQAAEQWAEAVLERFGRLDALVHNLGHFQPGTLLEGPVDQLTALINTNVLSAHYLTRAMLPLLEKGQRPCLLTVGSVATTDWPAPLAAYSISKYALEGWHRAMAKELKAKGVRCGLIRPGATYTRSWDGVDVDPQTLLSAQEVAQFAAQIILASPGTQMDELTIRPVDDTA